MASIRKNKQGGFRAEVCVMGQRKSKTFRSRSEAYSWSIQKENEARIDNAVSSATPSEFHPDLPSPLSKLFPKDFIVANANTLDDFSGVYFLINHDEIVYVGESRNVYARLDNHVLSEDKKFDRFYVIHCPGTFRKRLESLYIQRFTPIYNKTNG